MFTYTIFVILDITNTEEYSLFIENDKGTPVIDEEQQEHQKRGLRTRVISSSLLNRFRVIFTCFTETLGISFLDSFLKISR